MKLSSQGIEKAQILCGILPKDVFGRSILDAANNFTDVAIRNIKVLAPDIPEESKDCFYGTLFKNIEEDNNCSEALIENAKALNEAVPENFKETLRIELIETMCFQALYEDKFMEATVKNIDILYDIIIEGSKEGYKGKHERYKKDFDDSVNAFMESQFQTVVKHADTFKTVLSEEQAERFQYLMDSQENLSSPSPGQ